MDGLYKEKIPVLAVVGPTASGKTRLGIALCKRYSGEVVSADSMQIYKGMDIATAKPTPEEMEGIPHHLLDFLEPDQEFSVADYVERAHRVIGEIHSRGKLPVIVGGTGLYISSLLDNIDFGEIQVDKLRRSELEAMAREGKGPELHRLLSGMDPQLAGTLHVNDTGRIIRGILVYEATGKTLSEYKQESKRTPSPYRACMIGITYEDRQKLYDRINLRVDMMLEMGLEEEARAFYIRGLSRTARAAIGHKELYGYLQGEIGLDEAVENLKRETRRYAKRQGTWFRRDSRIRWIYGDRHESFEDLLEEASHIVDEFFEKKRERETEVDG